MQNTETQPKLRSKTKNQKRIEKLLDKYPNAVQGLNKGMLQLPNCPKEVQVSPTIIDFENDQNRKENYDDNQKVTKRELILFMIKKFNIFLIPDSEEENEKKYSSQRIKFKFERQKNFDSFLKLADSQEFEQQLNTITKKLRYWYEQDTTNIQGIESAHLIDTYQVPHKVVIDKKELKNYCSGDSKTDQSSDIKKVYRAFSFFFQARFNCVNATNKNREKMVFSRNYQFGFGDTGLSNFTTEQTKTLKRNFPSQKRIKTYTKNSNNKKNLKQNIFESDPENSSSSGEEIERETAVYSKILPNQERRIVMSQERNTSYVNLQRHNYSDSFTYPQKLESKTEQELEGELVWLLVNLKSSLRN
ncbi:hypothetical protein M0813_19232 [Anaeramoeba flamelloides]|uniref:Uncharacterized protein n=1 Tax=Anaeramoeba flamelloides TaxID=1746091 RepID=A0ABQ8YPY5_9EUKA|nr:hypothetical protein M0813_19232 [Anaeramoeba flamelloides]